MKKAFSLLELIFVIVIIGVIASFAIPRFMDTKNMAEVTTLKRDINTIVNSIQTHYLANGSKIEKIEDAITLDEANWSVEDKKVTDKNGCVTIEIQEVNGKNSLVLDVDEANNSAICTSLIEEEKLSDKSFDLY